MRENFQEGQPSVWGQLDVKPLPPRILGTPSPRADEVAGPGFPAAGCGVQDTVLPPQAVSAFCSSSSGERHTPGVQQGQDPVRRP